MKKIYCENCGSNQLEERGDAYYCPHCRTTWQKQEIDEVYDKLASILDEQKQERVANLRHQLYDELNADYLDSAEIIRICNEIKGYLPDDFQAKFFYVANKNSAAYLARYMRNLAPNKHLGYVPQILDFVLRSLQGPLINAANFFTEYAYGNNRDPKMYEKYNAILQREAQKVEASVYDPSVPRDVFVAYRSLDVRKMMELVEALEAEGLSCFVALRNLQHGKGATVDYESNLKKAMDSCKVVVLVSSFKSRTDSDAYRIELPYVKMRDLQSYPEYQNCYERMPAKFKKPRIEYIIEEHQNKAAEQFTKEFFNGFERLYSPEEVVRAVYKLKERVVVPEEAPKQEVKYCAACGKTCEKDAKFCSECGSREFVSTHDEYIATKAKRESDERIAKIKAEMQAQIDALKKAEDDRKAEEARKAKEAEDRKIKEEEARKAEEARTTEEVRKAEEAKKATKPYQIDGNSVTFGRYPQSKVTDGNLISALKRLAGLTPSANNSMDWTDYKYYIKNEVQSFMWYKDVSYGGEKYRAVYFDKWRPRRTNDSSSESNTYQGKNGYKLNTIYWFKWEPIQWKILQKSDGELTLFSDMLLDSQHYYNNSRTTNGKTIYANNYAQSDIRAWLNDNFYNAAFDAQEKNLIKTTLVDNSAATTPDSSNKYACENTYDKIYLLSYKEATNANYGFNSADDRKRKPTDYAQAQGAYAYTGGGYTGYWWLRSPHSIYGNHALFVYLTGDVYGYSVYRTDYGVAPALRITPMG